MKHLFISISFLIVLSFYNTNISAQELQKTVNKTDSTTINQLFKTALTNGECYQWLEVLSNDIGGTIIWFS